MSYRFMRVLVFFDLPVVTGEQRREYTKFRKFLLKSGFLMLQESVYCKISLNGTAQEQEISFLRKHRPAAGTVQMLSVTERQFSRMEYLVGDYNGDILQSDERLVIL